MSAVEGLRTLYLRPRYMLRGAHYSTKRDEKKASGFAKKGAGSLPQTADSSRCAAVIKEVTSSR
jgi:hypothetical protein